VDGSSGKRQTYQPLLGGDMPSLKKILTNKYLLFVIRLIVGLIFIYASIDKIKHPEQFARIVYNYKILPHFAINLFAIILPWLELVCGLFLVFGIMTRSSSLVISILLVLFIIALSINLFRGVDLGCGCFTTNLANKEHISSIIWRDLVLVLLSLEILFFAGRDMKTAQYEKIS
jgi:putative oxidoreductase